MACASLASKTSLFAATQDYSATALQRESFHFRRETHWQELVDELLRIRHLKQDWDGDGAVCPDVQIVDASINWLRMMPGIDEKAVPPSYVSVTTGGEILFVWQFEQLYVEAEVSAPDSIHWLESFDDALPRHWVTSGDVAVICD